MPPTPSRMTIRALAAKAIGCEPIRAVPRCLAGRDVISIMRLKATGNRRFPKLPQPLMQGTAQNSACCAAKKLRPALGGELAARDPVWDGEGWGCDRVAYLRCFFCQWAVAVATAGRLSPSETHWFGSLCD